MYKYIGPNIKVIESIVRHNTIKYAKASEFNDPFDCKPHFIEPSYDKLNEFSHECLFKIRNSGLFNNSLLNAKALNFNLLAKTRHLKNEVRNSIDKFGILCLSKRKDSILMWSHYAKNHRGVCVEFDIDSNFGEVLEVEYGKNYPLYDLIDYLKIVAHIESGGVAWNEEYDKLSNELVDVAFRKKFEDWKYEQEVRYIKPPSQGGSGLHLYDKSSLKGIIIGANADLNFSNKVKRLVKKYRNDIYIESLKMSESEFSLVGN